MRAAKTSANARTNVLRINVVWIALSAITLLSWALGSAREGADLVTSKPITVGVLAIGAIKARCILQYFMEVHTGPLWLRRFADIWLAVFWLTVLVIYLY